MDIYQLLEALGVKDNHAKAYISLIKLQKASPHAIAKDAGIERTTIYKIMEDISEKGLASKTVNGTRISYTAEHPNKFKEILESQSTVVGQLIPLLVALQGAKGTKPVVRFYDDLPGMRRILMDSLNAQEKFRRDFALVDNVTDILGTRFIHRQIDERVKRGIRVQSLRCKKEVMPPSEKDWYLKRENKDILREVRYLDLETNFEPFISIYDHIVTIISSREESYALVIESPEFSQAMKVLFDIAWKSAKK
ncbi:MAG: helix-turn-helix domain-containing protein [Candidatus Moranbacteria bacterium]|nr:helix-turn-helix domain-containing protein [Candidatus Moranbacteria bacterium]